MNAIPSIKKLGFGLMRLPSKDGKIDIEMSKIMVDEFIASGFTYFDTAFVYAGGESEKAVKELLTSRYDRNKFQLATKLALWLCEKEEDMQKQFETQLERTGAGYFDFYLLHSMGKERFADADRLGAWDFIKEQKAKGLVKHIGFSFHDTADVLDEALSKHPEIEFVQLQINYKDWEDEGIQSRRCYETVMKYGKKVVIMEPVKGGMLAGLAPEAAKIFKDANEKASLASWAIRFSASLDNVITVLSGMSKVEQASDNISYMKNFVPLSDSERETIDKVRIALENIETIQCTGCSYCTAGCPSKIKIPSVFSIYNEWLTYRNEERAKRSYARLITENGKIEDCIECGQCADICPQHLDIPSLIRKCGEVIEG